MTIEQVETVEMVFRGTPLGAWAARVVEMANSLMPRTSGVGYLDEDACLVGVGLTASGDGGVVVGRTTSRVITDLSRADACFSIRALRGGWSKVRPMPLPPVAILDMTWDAADGLVASITDLPAGARVFVEIDPVERDVVYDVWAVAPSTSPGGMGIWRRNDGKWEDDPGWISVLKGDSPPALVYLPDDSPVLPDVLAQVDESTAGKKFTPLTASLIKHPDFYIDLLPLLARGSRGGLKQATGVGSFWSQPESLALFPLAHTSAGTGAAFDPAVLSDAELLRIAAAPGSGLQGSADVLSPRDQLHVGRSNTQRHPTQMINGQVTLDGSDQSGVDVAVHLYVPAVDTDQSVPSVVLAAGPQPTSLCLLNTEHDHVEAIDFRLVRKVGVIPASPVARRAQPSRVQGLVASAGGRYTEGTGAAFTLVAGAAQATALDGLVAVRSNAGHVAMIREGDIGTLLARGSRGGLAKAAGVGKGGSAETLRRYWSEGKGATKIRWGTGGDWYRCTKQLRKYLGVRARGYCNLLHKRVLGYYPATHAKMIKGAKGRKG
jgi:hypothetical protein